jgi:ribosomal protein S18 acetylase RimI-like enzyme
MIREMENGEEDKIRALVAKLSFEDQTFWRGQHKPLEEYVLESSRITIDKAIKGKNVILVSEENGVIAGLCWCTIVDRGVDKQGEVAEFYVEKEFRGKGVGKDLMLAAKQLFTNEQVTVAFVWTHEGNKAAVELCKGAGFKEVDQLVMAYVPSDKDKHGVYK